MSEQNSSKTSPPPSNCDPTFTAGSVTLVLDAPRVSMTTPQLPLNFRSIQEKFPNISGATASGSAQYSPLQLQAMLDQNAVTTPLVIVDLRQEPHGFLLIEDALNGDTEIAVGWFAERDWLNVAKGLPSVLADEVSRLTEASQASELIVCDVISKSTTEDGICTANLHTVQPTAAYTEREVVQKVPKVSYLRLPSTDHCRPRDSEVDQFVAFEATLAPNTWLHFHCRAGDGRTTTFMAMHDIIHNAPGDTLQTILTRQGPLPAGINGVDLLHASTNKDIFDYPFSAERVTFMQNFYNYVCEAKPEGFKLTWSDWVVQSLTQAPLAASA
jgi:Inositol hexakisphosphate